LTFPVFVADTSTYVRIFARLDSETAGETRVVSGLDRSGSIVDENFASLFSSDTRPRAIWLGQGPGSFVGLRSSFAYARMYAMLSGIECRLFFSSRLWRSIFGLADSDWFLTRTNAKLYYADRFVPEREAVAVEAGVAQSLKPMVYTFADSWSSAKPIETKIPGRELKLAPEMVTAQVLAPQKLKPSEPMPYDALSPLYGHELNFVKKEKNG